MNRDDIIQMAKDAGLVLGYSFTWDHLERFAALVLASRKPLSDERILKIIEEQSVLTGWKVPPSFQIARAIELEHGIGGDK